MAIGAKSGMPLIPGILFLPAFPTRKMPNCPIWYFFAHQIRFLHWICVHPLSTELEKLENEGVQVYDAHQQMNVLVITPVICIVCDNPRASELANHLGATAKKYCRICMVSAMCLQSFCKVNL